MLFVFGTAGAVALAQSHTTIFVVVEHDSRVDTRLVRHARQEASRILAEARIAAVWPDCSGLGASPVCRNSGDPDVLRLRLVRETRSNRWKVSPAALGVALRPEAPTFGTIAFVFLDRVWAMADKKENLAALVLGTVFAHEIGHLLSDALEHTDNGLMKGDWRGQELAKIRQGNLRFSEEQAQAMRRSILARMDVASNERLARLSQPDAKKGTGGLAAPPVQ